MNKNWDREKIAKWNKYRFPLNNITKQRRKVEEEISEFEMELARSRKLEELADVYIAFAGLSRFTKIGAFVCKLFEVMPDYPLLEKQVNNKMEINNKRVFDKDMHHIDTDEAQKPEDDMTKAPHEEQPEYVTITKNFYYWKQDERGNWSRVCDPFTFTVLKSEYYKWG